MKKILVVGGAGFIGSYVNKLLNLAGYETLVLDNLSTGHQKAVVRGVFYQGDMADTVLLDSIFQQHQIAAVMHFAACIDVGESLIQPAKYYGNNVVNTLNLLNAMVRYRVNAFIFSSTAAIYGISQKKKITENDPCLPINPYGRSKLMVESILKDFELAYGLKHCCLRYFNAAGGDPEGEVKNYKSKESNLIPLVLKAALQQMPITIFGTDYETPDGTCIRDYIHIHDLGVAHLKALDSLCSTQISNDYNLGNGQGYSVWEILRAVEKVTGKQLIIKEGKRRLGDPAYLVADATKAQQQLNWHPVYPLPEEMILHAWQALKRE